MSRTIVCWTGPGSSTADHINKVLLSFDEKPQVRYQLFDGATLYQPKPDEVVLGFGKGVFDLLRDNGIIAKKFKTVESVRGKLFAVPGGALDGGQYMLTFHPALMKVDAEKGEEIAWDFRLAERFARTGGLKPEVGKYRWVTDFSELIAKIEAKYAETGKPVDVAGDSETVGKHPYNGDKIVCVGFTDCAGFADCLHFDDVQTEEHAKKVIADLTFLLTSPKIKMRGANFKFDMMWFGEVLKIECTNLAFDTLLAGSLVNENRSNSLNWHAKVYTTMGGYDDEFNDKYDKGRMDLVPKEDMLPYLGGDVDAVFRCADKIRQELMSVVPLMNLYINTVLPASHMFGRLERTGLLADPKRFEALRVKLEGQDGNGGYLADLDKKALALLPARIRYKYADNLSMSRPELLKDYFFSPLGLNLKPRMVTPAKGEPSTSKVHLSMFYDVPEAKQMVEIMAHRGAASKVLSTYVKGFLTYLRPDSRFHASYMLFKGQMYEDDNDDSGTNTGRLSAKDPAEQTIPKHWRDKSAPNWAKEIRYCYPAPPGQVIFSTDASQGELKIAACLAEEETMLAAYLEGLDLHAVTGSAMAGVPYNVFAQWGADPNDKVGQEKFDLGRYKAKAANFGLLYTMQAAGFVRYAWANFKMILTIEQAQDIIDRFFAKYPKLLDWHKKYKQLGRRDGYVVSPLGRVRHLPLINSKDWKVQGKSERQAINSPVQGTLSDITCMAMTEIDRCIPEAQMCAMIHDAALGYCPEDKAEEIGKRVVEIASNLPLKNKFGWDHQLKFNFDLEYGPDMGSMTKVKLAA